MLKLRWLCLVVLALVAACEGPVGPAGPQGIQGPAGRDGQDGAQGPPGPGTRIVHLYDVPEDAPAPASYTWNFPDTPQNYVDPPVFGCYVFEAAAWVPFPNDPEGAGPRCELRYQGVLWSFRAWQLEPGMWIAFVVVY